MYEPKISDLYITVNARFQTLELTWRNFDDPGGYILLAEDFPISAFEQKLFYYTVPVTDDSSSSSSTVSSFGEVGSGEAESGGDGAVRNGSSTTEEPPVATTQMVEIDWEYDFRDQYGQRKKEVLVAIKPMYSNGWTMTGELKGGGGGRWIRWNIEFKWVD